MSGKVRPETKGLTKSPFSGERVNSVFHARPFPVQAKEPDSRALRESGAEPLDAYLEGKKGTGAMQRWGPDEPGVSHSGMPQQLKAGLEDLSGMDLSGVRVHHNSPTPARMQALAFTQGNEIHLGPGQERYLPHEGWHAVQQMQGRVRSGREADGVSINDDLRLEREADEMGARALAAAAQFRKSSADHEPYGGKFAPSSSPTTAVQRMGSHGKHLHFKVTTIQITDSVTGAKRYVNANHDEDLGEIPTHGQGPAQRTEDDAMAIAAGAVVLGTNEEITDVNWDHYSKR